MSFYYIMSMDIGQQEQLKEILVDMSVYRSLQKNNIFCIHIIRQINVVTIKLQREISSLNS